MAGPSEAWCVVGITPEAPPFLVQLDPSSLEDSQFVCAFVVASVEALLAVWPQLPANARSSALVQILRNRKFEEVHALWSYQFESDGPLFYAYAGLNDALAPYHHWQPDPSGTCTRLMSFPKTASRDIDIASRLTEQGDRQRPLLHCDGTQPNAG
ncbi:hypothetical protein A9975_17340 [Cupriavidus sp. UME77]|nr:hypothetical protein [Cupriavidus sp. UME77]